MQSRLDLSAAPAAVGRVGPVSRLRCRVSVRVVSGVVMDGLGQALGRVRERLGRAGAARMGEQDTKAVLIEPVLQALGWDTQDPDEVTREYRRRGSDNPVDYALMIMRTPRPFVEAKGLGERMEHPRWSTRPTPAPASAA